VKMINIVAPLNMNISFFICAQALRAWLDPSIKTRINDHPEPFVFNLVIGDINTPFAYPLWNHVVKVWWLDTAVYQQGLDRSKIRGELWLTSMWNASFFKDYKKLIEEAKIRIVPRLVHPLFFMYDATTIRMSDKVYDLCIIATDVARKGVRLVEEACRRLRLKCFIASPVHEVKPYSLSTVSIINKLMLCKYLAFPSGAEGFGLPPEEAAVLGVPSIYISATALRERFYGFPIEPDAEIETIAAGGRMKLWTVSVDKFVETVKEALSITNEEYMTLAREVQDEARSRQYDAIEFVNSYILEHAW